MAPGGPEKKERTMDEASKTSLLERDKSFIVPLMIAGGILVVVLLLIGLFMPNVSWKF